MCSPVPWRTKALLLLLVRTSRLLSASCFCSHNLPLEKFSSLAVNISFCPPESISSHHCKHFFHRSGFPCLRYLSKWKRNRNIDLNLFYKNSLPGLEIRNAFRPPVISFNRKSCLMSFSTSNHAPASSPSLSCRETTISTVLYAPFSLLIQYLKSNYHLYTLFRRYCKLIFKLQHNELRDFHGIFRPNFVSSIL